MRVITYYTDNKKDFVELTAFKKINCFTRVLFSYIFLKVDKESSV